jgi:hypothetical protein
MLSRVTVAWRGLGAATLTLVGLALLIVAPWRGPVVVVFSSNQGFDLGDIPVVVLLLVAGMLVAHLPVAAGTARRLRWWQTTHFGDPRLAVMTTGALLLRDSQSRMSESKRAGSVAR